MTNHRIVKERLENRLCSGLLTRPSVRGRSTLSHAPSRDRRESIGIGNLLQIEIMNNAKPLGRHLVVATLSRGDIIAWRRYWEADVIGRANLLVSRVPKAPDRFQPPKPFHKISLPDDHVNAKDFFIDWDSAHRRFALPDSAGPTINLRIHNS